MISSSIFCSVFCCFILMGYSAPPLRSYRGSTSSLLGAIRFRRCKEMSRKKNKKKNEEYLINTIEYSTWENEHTLSRTYGDVVSTYIQTNRLPAAETTLSQHVVSDVTLMRSDDSPDDIEVDVVDVQPTTTAATAKPFFNILHTSTDVQPTTSTEIEKHATTPPPVTVNISGVENGFQLQSGATMKNSIVKNSNIVVSPSAKVTKPSVNKLFNPSTSTICLNRLESFIKPQETVAPKEKNKSSSAQKTSKKLQGATVLSSYNKQLSCEVCSKQFRYLSLLAVHMLTHKEERMERQICVICNSEFNSSHDLSQHLRLTNCHLSTYDATSRQEKPFTCKVCSKTFSSDWNLKKHEATHSDVKACNTQHMSTHKQHKVTHSDFHYKCPQCEYRSHHKARITRHMSTHNPQEKPFSCKVCSKTFSTDCDLKWHEVTHSDVKRYKCPQCEYRSHCYSFLTQHMSTKHSGEQQNNL